MSLVHASRRGLVPAREVDIQPNAVDIRLVECFEFVNGNMADNYYDAYVIIDDEDKGGTKHREKRPLTPRSGYDRGQPTGKQYFDLDTGKAYQFETATKVTIPFGCVGWVVPRSSLARNGIFVTSGLYDSCFDGTVGGCLFNIGGWAKIEVGARIGQFVMAEAEALFKYNGQYQNANRLL